MQAQVQLVPVFPRRDPRAGAATTASPAGPRAGGACGPTGASVLPGLPQRRRQPGRGRAR
jgi:hypothetical protein